MPGGIPGQDTPQVSAGAGITPWIGAAGGLISDITSLFGQSAANRQSQRYNTQMIQMQRKWSLEDQAAQNLYNSPTQQMARLKAGGLNPNMVYGTGVQGSTGQQSGQPRSVSIPSWNPQSVTQGFGNLGEKLIDSIQKVANIANTKADTERLGKTSTNIAADTVNKEKLAALQDIRTVIEGSEGRADPRMQKWYQEQDQNIQGYRENEAGNASRVSNLAPERATFELLSQMDENSRRWAENAREQVRLQKSIPLMEQALSNAIEENAGMKQRNLNSAAEFLKIMSSSGLQELERMNKNMPQVDVTDAARTIFDAIILSKALKGGASPAAGKAPDYKTPNPFGRSYDLQRKPIGFPSQQNPYNWKY